MVGDLDGLVLVLSNGSHWRWVDYEFVVNRHGREVRIEHLARQCRHCGTPFTVTTKIPAAVVRRYHVRAQREAGDIVIEVPAGLRLWGLELVNCPTHRHSTYIRDEELA